MCFTIEMYLQQVGQCRKSQFGKQFRSQFRDARGTAELAMLASPSEDEFNDFCQAVRSMTDEEKVNIELLTDEVIAEIAQRANADYANISIFFNGYILEKKKRKK